jgi:hypothetical protein
MPRKTVVCPECGKPVPAGRLACPSCGSLVAAVTGPARRSTRPATKGAAGSPGTQTPTGSREQGRDVASNGTDLRANGSDLTSNGRDPGVATGPTFEDESAARSRFGIAEPLAPSRQRSTTFAPAAIPSILQDWPPKPPRTLDDPTGRELGNPAEPRWGLGNLPEPSGAPVSGAYVPPAATGDSSTPYLSPSAVFSSGTPNGGARPIGGAGPATTSSAPVPIPTTPSSSGTVSENRGVIKPGSASLFADLPFDAPNSLTGWLVAFGAGAATLGFFLPWSTVVIGAASAGGSYMETWGLASPNHVFVLVVCLVGFLLSVLPNRVPAWLRISVLGLVLGGVLIGLAWPYLFDAGVGYRVGVIAEIVGSLVLIVGGVLSILPARHDSDATSV